MDINTLKFRFYESIENKALAAEYKKVKDIFPNTSHTEERQETVIVPHDDGRPDEERVITKQVVVEECLYCEYFRSKICLGPCYALLK